MIITSHMQKNYSNPSMFTKLSHKQESVTADRRGYFYIPHRYRREIKTYIIKYGGSRDCMVVGFITTYAISPYHQ